MEEVKGTETIAAPIPPQEKVEVALQDDLQARNELLEAEKSKLIEEAANYRVAYLKEKSKSTPEDEEEDDKIRRIAHETLANSRIAEIAREQDSIIKRALKENHELKLANKNKPDVPASIGAHSEGIPVKDTIVTPEQITAFKARGWTDKDIERYKKNLIRYSGR